MHVLWVDIRDGIMSSFNIYFCIMLVFDVVFVRKYFFRNSRKKVRKFLSEVVFPKLFGPKAFDMNVVFQMVGFCLTDPILFIEIGA